MKVPLKRLFCDDRPESFPAAKRSLAEVGGYEPQLRRDVEVHPLCGAAGEPMFALVHPEKDETLLLTPAQHRVVSNLDGGTSIAEAIETALKHGELPIGMEKVLLDLWSKGFLSDPEGTFQRLYAEERPFDHLTARTRRALAFLWGRDSSSRALARILPKVRPLAILFSNSIVFWISLTAGLLGAIRLGQSVINGEVPLFPEGPQGMVSILALAVALWLFHNLAVLVPAAGSRLAGAASGARVGFRWYLGVPLLRQENKTLLALPWQEALRRRLSGIALLGFLSCPAVVYLQGASSSGMSSALVILAGALYLTAFINLSPWWNSALRQSFSHALPGVPFPWACWAFLWKRFWSTLFLGKRHDKLEAVFLGFTIYLVLWSVLALRLAAFLLKHGVVLLYRDAVVAATASSGWVLLALAILLGALLSLAILTGAAVVLIRAPRSISRLALWDRPLNILLALLVLAFLLMTVHPFLSVEAATTYVNITLFVLFLALGIGAGLFRSGQRASLLSPGMSAVGFWGVLCAISLLWSALSPGGLAGRYPPLDLWNGLLPVSGILLFIASFAGLHGEKPPSLITLLGCMAGIILSHLLFEDREASVMTLAFGAVLMLAWGTMQAGGMFRRLAYLQMGGFGLLAARALNVKDFALLDSLGIPALLILLAVPLIHGRLKYRQPASSGRARVPGTPLSDRESLVFAASRLWREIQRQAGWLAGRRVVLSARRAGAAAGRFCRVEQDAIHLRQASDSDLAQTGADLARILDAATPIWLACCGRKFVRLAAEAGYARLTWEGRQLLGEYVLRGGQWWKQLLPDALRADRMDPQAILKRHVLFSQLDEGQKQKLVAALKVQHFDRGENVVRQGEAGDRMYIILQGNADVLSEDVAGMERLKVSLHEGDYFGQTALLHDCERTATVRAGSDLWVAGIEREDFQSLFGGTPVAEDLRLHIQKVNRLHDLPLFRALSIGDLEFLAEQCIYREYESGQTIVRERQPADEFYLIDQGEVEVSQQGRAIRTMVAGQYFGEIALLFDIPRTATVAAVKECRCLVVPGKVVKDLVEHLDGFRAQLESIGQTRMERDRRAGL